MAATKSPHARLLHIRDEIEGVAATINGLSFEKYCASYIHRRGRTRRANYLGSCQSSATGLFGPV